MKIKRFDWDGQDPRGLAAEIRALQPALGEVSEPVAGDHRRGARAAAIRR